MSNEDLFDAIFVEAKNLGLVSSKVRFGRKSDFWYHSWFNFLLNLIYPKDRKNVYLTRYWTVIGYTIAATDKDVDSRGRCSDWPRLLHEMEHTRQARKWTRPLFAFLYLWPLSQGILFILLCWLPALFVSGWVLLVSVATLLLVGGIHFMPQWPDPWRTYWEFKAYEISMFFHSRCYGKVGDEYIKHLVKNFSSMSYYMMEPRKKKIRARLERTSLSILLGKHPVKKHPLVKLAQRLRSWA